MPKCPEGYVHVFGPLCVSETRLKRFTGIPDFPKPEDFKLQNIDCESALAAYNKAMDAVENLLGIPKMMMELAEDVIEMPIDMLDEAIGGALGVLDVIGGAIDKVLGGAPGALSDFLSSLESLLDCPFIADTEIGAMAAEIVDEIQAGLLEMGSLEKLKRLIKDAVMSYVNQLADYPLSTLENAQDAFDKFIEDSGIGDALQKARDLEQCVRAACHMGEVATRIPASAEGVITNLKGTWQNGKFTATLVTPISQAGQTAMKAAANMAKIINWP